MKNETDSRFVAHLDMLGMSALALRDPDLAWAALSALSRARDERFGLELKIAETGQPIQDRVTTFTFSDTVVAFTVGDTIADLRAIVVLVTEFFAMALSLCIPLRGGIAYGRFMFNFDYNLFAGPALVHAYHIGEETQWLGLRVDEEVAARAKAVPLLAGPRNEPTIMPWVIPDERDTNEPFHVINWVASHRTSFTVSRQVSVLEFYEPFEDMFGVFESLPSKIQRKYINTVAFLNSQLCKSAP